MEIVAADSSVHELEVRVIKEVGYDALKVYVGQQDTIASLKDKVLKAVFTKCQNDGVDMTMNSKNCLIAKNGKSCLEEFRRVAEFGFEGGIWACIPKLHGGGTFYALIVFILFCCCCHCCCCHCCCCHFCCCHFCCNC